MAATVFEPVQLGPTTLRNRLVKAATFEGRTPAAVVSPELVDFHRAIAAGGIGMTTVAYVAVSPEGRTHREQIFLREAAVPGLVRLTEPLWIPCTTVAGSASASTFRPTVSAVIGSTAVSIT